MVVALRIVPALCVSLILATSSTLWSQSHPERDCPPDLVCYSVEESAEILEKLVRLEEQVELLKLKKARLFSPFVAGGISSNLEDNLTKTPYGFIGARFWKFQGAVGSINDTFLAYTGIYWEW